MPDKTEKHSLADSQIQSSYQRNSKYLGEAMREATSLLADKSEAKDTDQVYVSVASLRTLARGLIATNKMIAEAPSGGRRANTGDRGTNCDYNPFNKVDFGDVADWIRS